MSWFWSVPKNIGLQLPNILLLFADSQLTCPDVLRLRFFVVLFVIVYF